MNHYNIVDNRERFLVVLHMQEFNLAISVLLEQLQWLIEHVFECRGGLHLLTMEYLETHFEYIEITESDFASSFRW